MRPEDVPAEFNFAQDVIGHWARATPETPALWCVDETTHAEQRLTFAQIELAHRRAASFFLQSGIARADRVLMVMHRRPEWWVAILGLTAAGAVPIPATVQLTSRDLEHRLRAASPRAVIADEESAATVDAALDAMTPRPGVIRLLIGANRPGWQRCDFEGADPNPDLQPTRADDPGMIYFTSGTSGPPKMALHTQASYGFGHRATGEHWLCLAPGVVHWVLADVGWGKAAWSALFGPWSCGATVFMATGLAKFHPRSTLKTLSSFPIASFCAPPTALRLLVAEDLSAYRFPRLRHCTSAGEALTEDLYARWKNATGLSIHEGYGQTETIILVGNFARAGRPVRPGSMGHPTPGYDVCLIDEQLNELPAGREGHLALKVRPNRPIGLFKEYVNDLAETALRFRGDYYFTGDVARRDEDGYYYHHGRADDIINSSSYRIGPYEVESALSAHPAVLECAVVGHPDELRGQIVRAFVVLRPGFAPTDALRREIQEHCRHVTAPYKYPRMIDFVTELPKTTNGKIRRSALRGE